MCSIHQSTIAISEDVNGCMSGALSAVMRSSFPSRTMRIAPSRCNSDSHRHDGFGNGTPLFSDVCRACDRRACQGIGARVREPQNFVEFRGAEPVALAGLPYDVMDKPFELVPIEYHRPLAAP